MSLYSCSCYKCVYTYTMIVKCLICFSVAPFGVSFYAMSLGATRTPTMSLWYAPLQARTLVWLSSHRDWVSGQLCIDTPLWHKYGWLHFAEFLCPPLSDESYQVTLCRMSSNKTKQRERERETERERDKTCLFSIYVSLSLIYIYIYIYSYIADVCVYI